MFALIRDRQRFSEQGNCAVYACTVGLRPSHAGYYLSEMAELRQLLKALQDKSISANRSYSTTDLTVSVCDGVGLHSLGPAAAGQPIRRWEPGALGQEAANE